ncbi:hypothetical protein ALC62_04800, partial [Cyphomyrmex costatus]
YTDAMARMHCDDCVQCCLTLKQQVVFDIVDRHFTWLSLRAIQPYASRHAHSWGLSLTIARARDDSRMEKLVKRLTHDVVIAHYNRRCVMQAGHVCRTLQL